MLEKLFNGDDRDDETRVGDRQTLIRDRMRADGINEEEATRLVLAEEELAVGRREVSAGEVEVSKRVDTRHVQEQVPVRHDEVEIERRPITDGYAAQGASIGDEGEIRVPLHAEEVVVEKRVVPTEELVVKKRTVTDTETVEADLRRERADIHREGDTRGTDPMR